MVCGDKLGIKLSISGQDCIRVAASLQEKKDLCSRCIALMLVVQKYSGTKLPFRDAEGY